VVLAGSLGVASWLIYRKRSRKGLIGLSLFSIAYFGFWRKGCICAIGSPQNVALALADPSYAVPWVAVAFFALPLAFALFGAGILRWGMPSWGIAGPVLLKPQIAATQHSLGILPYVYQAPGFCLPPRAPLFSANTTRSCRFSG
jgi:hypothetical protein